MAGKGNQNIDFAGDFNLSSIVLHSHLNKGRLADGGNKVGVDIKDMVQEFNIYENMFKGAITGSLVVADATNLIGSLPIQGTERLSFKLSTPGMPDIDCSPESGHPMHIYKLTDKKQSSDGLQIYVLHFCSREFLRNLRTKTSKAYSGRLDQMVNSILGDKDLLDSRKKLFYQETRNQDKIVMPNVNPFTAISMLCKRALSSTDKSSGAGYYFYETSKGFHFRSWESLCVKENGTPRKPKQTFRYMPMNITDENVGDKILHDFTSVEDYRFVNNFHDVAANTALGTYGHRVITHNIFNKSYKIDDYHYHNRWNESRHLEKYPAISDSPVDYDTVDGDSGQQKGVSDYPESRISLQSTAPYINSDKNTGNFGEPVEVDGILEGTRLAQVNKIMSGTQLEMTVNGQSRLQAGDAIEFDLQSVENKENSRGALDIQYSGRYIITSIRHRVAQEKFLQVLTCVKDSSKSGYHYSGDKSFTEISGGVGKKTPRTVDLDDYDSQPKSTTTKPLGDWYPGAN